MHASHSADPSGNVYAVLDGWSALSVAGPDAVRFVQSFCTNDVAALAVGDSCEAFFTDVKAHVLAYGVVARLAETLVVVLSSAGADALCAHLDRYLIREQVTLQTLSDQQLLLLGCTVDPKITASVVTVVAAGWPAGVRFAIVPATAVTGVVHQLEQVAKPLDAEALERQRIAWGIPRDGVDVDARNLPQEVDRNEHAISFKKGCYLGQEPVARIDALGRVNWLLRGVRIEGPAPASGTALREAQITAQADEKSVGRITSSAATASGAIALAYLRREHATVGLRVRVNGVAAIVESLPMIVREASP
ncbi:CAF17-like 4Fe-4S cluster assembly/insertion protein YgfZ [Botrimarina hoheduenensis]|nr:folate-binding protein YgfZ [Botrimarina hoheduenensis]